MNLPGRILTLCVAALIMTSCQYRPVDLNRKMVLSGKTQDVSRNSTELAYQLSTETWCSNDDACSMVLLLIDGEDRCEEFEQRLITLDVKGLASV